MKQWELCASRSEQVAGWTGMTKTAGTRKVLCINPWRVDLSYALLYEAARDLAEDGWDVTWVDASYLDRPYGGSRLRWLLSVVGRTNPSPMAFARAARNVGIHVAPWWRLKSSTMTLESRKAVTEFLYRTEQSILTAEMQVPVEAISRRTRRSIDRSVSHLIPRLAPLIKSTDEVVVVNGRTRVGAIVTALCSQLGKEFTVLEVGTELNSWTSWRNTYPQDDTENAMRMTLLWNQTDESTRRSEGQRFLQSRIQGDPLQGWRFQPEKHDVWALDRIVEDVSQRHTRGFVTFYPTSGVEFSITKPGERAPSGADQAKAFGNLCRAAQSLDLGVVVRVHPQPWGARASVEDDIWRERASGYGAYVVPAEAAINSYELARRSFATATHSSSIGPELVGIGVPCLVLGEPFWASLMGELHATTEDGIASYLRRRPTISSEWALPWAFYMLMRGKPYLHVTVGSPGNVQVDGRRVDRPRLLSRLLEQGRQWFARTSHKIGRFT
jgi:hypothetical protein